MHLPIKPICESRFIRKDGTSLIYIQYCHSADKRILLNTKIAIPPKLWNKRKLCVVDNLDLAPRTARELNDDLRRMIRMVEDIIRYANENKIEDPEAFAKSVFKPSLDIKDLRTNKNVLAQTSNELNQDIYFQIDDYINSKIKKVCKDMPRIYRNMKDHLKAFETFRNKPITFDCLDLNFYEEFVDFLTYDYIQRRRLETRVGLKTNTVGKTIKQFRTFLRNRIRKRIIPVIDMDGWTILEEQVDAVYLPLNEINLIYKLDLTHFPHLEDYRNDFVLGCLTGLRFSDFSKLDKNDLRQDMLYKKQQKSDHWVVISLRKEAKEILSKRFDKDVQAVTNAEFNRHIKTIAKLAGLTQLVKHSHKIGNKNVVKVEPKYAYITSHTCRRSFCTNEFLAGTPVELIMKISGHKSVKDFYKYIRITPEEAGQKIKELWQLRGGMNAFSNDVEIAYRTEK